MSISLSTLGLIRQKIESDARWDADGRSAQGANALIDYRLSVEGLEPDAISPTQRTYLGRCYYVAYLSEAARLVDLLEARQALYVAERS